MKHRVLVVDDAPEVCELVEAVLTSAGMEVLVTTDSQQAAGHLAREKFDAVFLDVRMPEPDGIELARRARASGFNQKTPIVMITGDVDPKMQGRAFQAGANFFLYKPLDHRRLLRILRVTQGSIQQERRRFQRVSVRVKATVECGSVRLDCTTLDMSLNGVLLQSTSAFPQESKVTVTIQLKPGLPAVLAVGRVARVIGADCMGIELRQVSQADSERLQEFLLPLILAVTDEEAAVQQK